MITECQKHTYASCSRWKRVQAKLCCGRHTTHTETHTHYNQSAMVLSHYSDVCRGLSSAQLLMQYSAMGFTGWLGRQCSEVTEQSLVGVCVCVCLCVLTVCVCVCTGHEAQDTAEPKIDLSSTCLTREDSFDRKSTSLWMNVCWSPVSTHTSIQTQTHTHKCTHKYIHSHHFNGVSFPKCKSVNIGFP